MCWAQDLPSVPTTPLPQGPLRGKGPLDHGPSDGMRLAGRHVEDARPATGGPLGAVAQGRQQENAATAQVRPRLRPWRTNGHHAMLICCCNSQRMTGRGSSAAHLAAGYTCANGTVGPGTTVPQGAIQSHYECNSITYTAVCWHGLALYAWRICTSALARTLAYCPPCNRCPP